MTDETGKKQGGRFARGESGNPSGRPRGSRNRSLILLDQIGEGSAKEVLETVIGRARRGDLRAAEIILRRLWPEPRGRQIALKLPRLKTAADATSAIAAVVSAVSQADITPSEGKELVAQIESFAQTLQISDLEQRLRALQDMVADPGK